MANGELLTAEDAPLLARPFYMDGDPGPIARALAHLPELMELGLPFIGSVFAAGAVDARGEVLRVWKHPFPHAGWKGEPVFDAGYDGTIKRGKRQLVGGRLPVEPPNMGLSLPPSPPPTPPRGFPRAL